MVPRPSSRESITDLFPNEFITHRLRQPLFAVSGLGPCVLYDRGTGSMAVHLLLLYPIQSNLLKNLREGKPFFSFGREDYSSPSLLESLYVFTRYPPTQHFFPSLPSGFPPNRRGYRYSSPLLPLCALALKQPRDQISRYEHKNNPLILFHRDSAY